MTAHARYSYSPERNRLLLLALVQAWGNKCYWCRTPKTFRDLEIDHIVPRNPRGGSDPDFDVDAAENLAPICGPCNREKNNGEFEDAPRIDAIRNAAVKAAAKVRRNLDRFYKDDSVVKALLAVTAADLASPDVAEAISGFGAAIMPVFRESFPDILTQTYTWDYTIRKPPLTFQGQEVDLPGERSLAEFDAQGQRALIILEDVIGISMADAIDDVRRSVEGDVDEQINSKLRDGMGGYYVNSHADERPCSNGINIFVTELRYEVPGVVLTGELEGILIVELEEYDPDPQRWSNLRKADFDFAADFSVTFSRGEVSNAWVDVTKLAENEWRGRASRMQFYDD